MPQGREEVGISSCHVCVIEQARGQDGSFVPARTAGMKNNVNCKRSIERKYYHFLFSVYNELNTLFLSMRWRSMQIPLITFWCLFS